MDFDPQKNYYEILGIWEESSSDDIKKAFKKLAIKHHPDKWWEKKKFQEINEAYQTLSDDKKRQQYDAYRKWWFNWFGWWGFDFGWWGFDFGWWDIDLWDIVGNFFWWWFGWSRRKNTWWEDIKIAINITFEESYLWTSKKVWYDRLIKSQWAQETKCETCNGRGVVSQQVQTPFGIMQTQWACPKCWWTGKIYTKDWKILPNWWLEKTRETIQVQIPEWIKSGSYIKYANKWHQWISWANADLYIRIDVSPSSSYERRWDNLYVTTSVSIFDLVLWWEVSVNHPTGKIKVKIPKWTQIWDMIKISWKWFWASWIFNKKWDMYIIPKLEIPKKLSKDQEKLRTQLKNS